MHSNVKHDVILQTAHVPTIPKGPSINAYYSSNNRHSKA